MKTVNIIPYQNDFAQEFYDLNIEWLNTYFYVEPFDEEVLSNPEHYIINKGGYIFFAERNNNILGTVALMPTDAPTIVELTKMAVKPSSRGQKIGQQLLEHCIGFSKAKGLTSIMLYSARKLENAIYIYKKFGFMELELEPNNPYKRSDIKMEVYLL